MAGRIFVSYRRADTADQASWLFGRLAGHFGPQQVVRDVDPAQSGGDLAQAIAAAVGSCDVVVLLIGHHWLAVAGEGLHDPGDYVRLELESALARGVLVIPVLVDGARMPVDGELPPSLAGMAGQPALELSPNDPDADAARLLQVLDQSIAERQATQVRSARGPSTAPGPRASGGGGPGPGRAPHPTRPMPPRRRPRPRTVALVAAGIIAAQARLGRNSTTSPPPSSEARCPRQYCGCGEPA